jgi:hypothetical protein
VGRFQLRVYASSRIPKVVERCLAMCHPRLGPAHHRVGVGGANDGERDEERGLARERGHVARRRL